MNYDNIYIDGLKKILDKNSLEFNQRKNSFTYRYFGLDIRLNDIDYLPLLNVRKMFPKTVAAELAWSLLGTQSTEFIKKYSSIWNNFEDEPDKVIPAYGYRWRKHFGRDQIFELINHLKKDKAGRHGIVSTWDPSIDGLNNVGKYKNTPCPYTFACNIIDNKLNLHVTQRSGDMIIGIPYDIAMYGLLKKALAKSLHVEDGDLMFSIIDAHIYKELKEATDIMINNLNMVQQPFTKKLECLSIEEIINNPDYFVDYIIDYSKDYNPIDNIKKLKVVQ